MKRTYVNDLRKCPHCGKFYSLGVDGVKGTCDECGGRERDINGQVWREWQTEQVRWDVNEQKLVTIYRKDVFPQKED